MAVCPQFFELLQKDLQPWESLEMTWMRVTSAIRLPQSWEIHQAIATRQRRFQILGSWKVWAIINAIVSHGQGLGWFVTCYRWLTQLHGLLCSENVAWTRGFCLLIELKAAVCMEITHLPVGSYLCERNTWCRQLTGERSFLGSQRQEDSDCSCWAPFYLDETPWLL